MLTANTYISTRTSIAFGSLQHVHASLQQTSRLVASHHNRGPIVAEDCCLTPGHIATVASREAPSTPTCAQLPALLSHTLALWVYEAPGTSMWRWAQDLWCNSTHDRQHAGATCRVKNVNCVPQPMQTGQVPSFPCYYVAYSMTMLQ